MKSLCTLEHAFVRMFTFTLLGIQKTISQIRWYAKVYGKYLMESGVYLSKFTEMYFAYLLVAFYVKSRLD